MKRQSFFKGVALLTAAGIIVKLMGFVYRVVLTNLPGYGDEGNGIYGAGYQVYLILFAISTTGFPAAISKLVAERMAERDGRGAHRIFKVAFILLLTTGFFVSLLFFLSSGYISRLISNERTAYTMIALSPTIFFVSIMAAFRGYFQGLRDMTPQAGSQVVEQLGKMVFTIILAYVLMPYGVEMAAAGATMGTTIGAAIGAAYLWKLYSRRKEELWTGIRRFSADRKPEPAMKIIKKLVSISIPISLGAVIMTVSNLIDLGTVMNLLTMSGIDDGSANRMYGILTGKCYVLTNFPVAVNTALAANLVPAVAGAVAVKDYRSASQKITASIRLSILIGLPSTVGMAVLAGPILKMLFPGSSEGAYLLTISAFTIIFTGLTQTLSGILQGLGKVFIPALSLFAGAVVKLIMNFTLMPMPHINIKGAVYGTLVCYIISTAINIVALKRNFRLNLNLYNLIIKPVVAVIVMGACTWYTYGYLFSLTASNAVSTAASIVASAGVFGLIIIITGAVGAKEISLLPFGENINRMLKSLKLLRR